MTDCLSVLDPEYCPDLDDCHAELRALLPRGKAWSAAHRVGTGLWRFWRALAHPLHEAHQRICDLRRQFWCRTTDELFDQWLVEYGLPDACDPFPDVCAKVTAVGGTRCEYYQAVALRAGWNIDCEGPSGVCGAIADDARADCAVAGGGEPLRSLLTFTVHLPSSPAYRASGADALVADCAVTDQAFGCAPDIGPLVCVLERIVPAHVEIVYVLDHGLKILAAGADAIVVTETGAPIPVEA